MPDFHPVISSVPAVLLVVAAIFEVLSLFPANVDTQRAFRVSARYLLLFLAIILPLTFYSGLLAGEGKNFSEEVEQAVSLHYDRARLLLFISAIACLLCWIAAFAREHKGVFRGAYYLALLGAVGVACLTSYQGGALVFEHGVGVSKSFLERVPTSSGPPRQLLEQEWEQDREEGEDKE